MGIKSIIDPFRSARGKLRKHPRWATVGALGLVGILWDWLGRLQTGAGLMETWLGEEWFRTVLLSPWFKLVCLAGVVLAIWRIGVLSLREEAAARVRETSIRNDAQEQQASMIKAVIEEQAAGFTAALQEPINIAKRYGRSIVWSHSETLLANADKAANEYEDTVERYRNRVPEVPHLKELFPNGNNVVNILSGISQLQEGLIGIPFDGTPVRVELPGGDAPTMIERVFDPSKNEQWFHNHAASLETLRAEIARARMRQTEIAERLRREFMKWAGL